MNPSKPPTGDYVVANYRYISAYNEVVARINQRQNTLTLFVAIFSGLITALIATREMVLTSHGSVVWIMVGFPFASISLTLLNFKYERLLSLLRHYLADLESLQDAHLHLPSYNCNSSYARKANAARSFHDLTCASLIVAYNLVAIGLYVSICGAHVKPNLPVIVAVGIVAVICFLAHLGLHHVHYRPDSKAVSR